MSQQYKGRKIVRRIRKKEVQRMIRALRQSGLTVEKSETGIYTCKASDEFDSVTLFLALPGRNDYMVSMVNNLFV